MAARMKDYAISATATRRINQPDARLTGFVFPLRFAGVFRRTLGTPDTAAVVAAEPIRAPRRYRPAPDSRDRFETEAGGVVLLTDSMTPRGDRPTLSHHRMQARLRAYANDLTVRFDYGSVVPWSPALRLDRHPRDGGPTLYFRSAVPCMAKTCTCQRVVATPAALYFDLSWHPTMLRAAAARCGIGLADRAFCGNGRPNAPTRPMEGCGAASLITLKR